MSENKKYTIIVKKQRVEVSEAVYHAYHKEREAERYISQPEPELKVLSISAENKKSMEE